MVRCVLQLWWRRSSWSCSDSCLRVTLSGESLSLYSNAIRTHWPPLPAFDLLIRGFVPCYYLLFMFLKMAAHDPTHKSKCFISPNCHKQPGRFYSLVSGGNGINLNLLVNNYITEMTINQLMNEIVTLIKFHSACMYVFLESKVWFSKKESWLLDFRISHSNSDHLKANWLLKIWF